MKSVSLLYPYDSVLKLLQTILTRKGHTILSVNPDEGIIKASCKKGLFQKCKTIDIKVEKRNHNITYIAVCINGNPSVYEKPMTDDEQEEEELFDTIHKYF